MDHTSLARAFDSVTGPLTAAGHGVIVRHTRALLADGDVDGAIAFVKEAGERSPLMAFDTLHGALAGWHQEGNSPSGLRRNAAWKKGIERSDRVADEIASLTADSDLPTLLGRLMTETQAAGAVPGEDYRATGPQAIGSIFGARETGSQAVVEETSNLVPRSLSLNESVVSDEPTPLEAPPSEAPTAASVESAQVPVPPVEFTEPPTVQSDPPDMDELVADEAPQADPPAKLPEPPPPAVDTQAPTSVDRPEESTASLWVGLAIVVAAIVLLIWYTNRT